MLKITEEMWKQQPNMQQVHRGSDIFFRTSTKARVTAGEIIVDAG